MSTKRPSRFSPSLSFKLPPHGEDPIPRETNLLVNKLTLLLSRVSSGIDVTRSELTSIHFKVDEIEEIIEGYEEEDSPRRGYEHVFDTEGPRRLIFGTNETTDRYKDLTPIKSLERRSKTLGMKDSRRRQPLSQRQMSPNKVVLMAEEAAELNLKLRQAFRELQEQGGQFKPVPKASLEPNTTRFQQGAVRAPSKRSSPSTEEASETACSATNPSPGRRQAFDVSRQEEGLSLQEPAIDTDKHNREDPLPGASNQPTKAHQVAHQATDLAFTLESTITELQARREEALVCPLFLFLPRSLHTY